MSRKVWDIRPTKLPDVRGKLGIEPKHHEGLSDARARAQIVMAAHTILESTRRVLKPREVRALGANP